MSDLVYKRIKVILICAFFCVCFIVAAGMPMQYAPDEGMRFPIALFIYNNGYLPEGTEAEVVNQIWGFSYVFNPYVTSIFSAFFMKIVSVFINTEMALLTAARMTSILSGIGTLIFTFKLGELLFKRKEYALMLGTFVGFLPQFVFLCTYQNNDSFAVFTSAMILYFWARALRDGFDYKICIGLGFACGLCMLSYYNAYIFLLGSLVFYFFQRIRDKDAWVYIIRDAIIILTIAFVIAGWFFIRNAALHDGDFLGFTSTRTYGEMFAMEGFKPSQRMTPASEHLSISETFFGPNMFQGESSWAAKVAMSFIGLFNLMSIPMSKPIYIIYLIIFAAGFIFCAVWFILNRKGQHQFPASIRITLPLMIVVNLLLFIYYTYFSDYQAQGRYMMPSLIPIMLIITEGYRRIFYSVGRSRAYHLGKTTAAEIKNTAYDLGRRISILVICLYIVLFFVSYLCYMVPGCVDTALLAPAY